MATNMTLGHDGDQSVPVAVPTIVPTIVDRLTRPPSPATVDLVALLFAGRSYTRHKPTTTTNNNNDNNDNQNKKLSKTITIALLTIMIMRQGPKAEARHTCTRARSINNGRV